MKRFAPKLRQTPESKALVGAEKINPKGGTLMEYYVIDGIVFFSKEEALDYKQGK